MKFSAHVIKGSGRGKGLDCPTINLDPAMLPQEVLPGVYACFARMGQHGVRLPASMHIGPRPTFDDSFSCEVHVLDQVITLPPRSVEVDVVKKLRDIEDFGSKEALQAQMQRDNAQARSLLLAPC